jgi:cell division protein FtsX
MCARPGDYTSLSYNLHICAQKFKNNSVGPTNQVLRGHTLVPWYSLIEHLETFGKILGTVITSLMLNGLFFLVNDTIQLTFQSRFHKTIIGELTSSP